MYLALRAASLLAFFVLALSGQDNWPQFRRDPLLTGVAPGPLGVNLAVAWTHEAGTDPVESSAAIVGGVVYVGSQAGELIALDLNDGKLKWKYKANEGIGESSPAVADGVVLVGDLTGVLHAVNAADGKGLWTLKTLGEIKASPVIVGDKVVVGSYDGHLYCAALKTGKLLWNFLTKGPVHATAAVKDGVAYISGCDGVLRGIRIADGKQVSEIPTGAYTGASPANAGSRFYFGTFNNDVLAFDLRTRKQVWEYENPDRQFPFYSSAALADGKVVLGGRDKLVHALDAASGKEIWSFATRARIDSSPAIVEGRVYIGSNDGRLYVLDLKKGTKLSEFNAGSALTASPAIAAGRLVIGTQDGKVFCLKSE
jgi:outer membrane protein assembly factor BamB